MVWPCPESSVEMIKPVAFHLPESQHTRETGFRCLPSLNLAFVVNHVTINVLSDSITAVFLGCCHWSRTTPKTLS